MRPSTFNAIRALLDAQENHDFVLIEHVRLIIDLIDDMEHRHGGLMMPEILRGRDELRKILLQWGVIE